MKLHSLLATLAFAAISLSSSLAAQTTPAPAASTNNLTPAQESRLMLLGKRYTRWMLEGKSDSLASAFDEGALDQIGGIEGVKAQIANFIEHTGSEISVAVEKMNRRRGLPQFWHEGNFTGMTTDAIVIRWLLDLETGKIVGAGAGPKATTPAPDS